MRAKRNDPCPCGSAKKYKACCMPRDLARERIKAVVGEDVLEAAEEQIQAIVSEQTVWEADVLTPPFPSVDGDVPPSLAVVTAAGFIVHGEPVLHRLAGAGDRATAIAQAVSAAGRSHGRLPERLRVRDAELAAALAPLLSTRAVEVEAGPMPELDEAVREVMSQVLAPPAAQRLVSPGTWRETGASRQALDAFHRAAAEFYRLEPWEDEEMQPPLALETPDGARWAASVMGEGGVAYGLAMYSAPEDLLHLLLGGDPFDSGRTMSGYALTVDFEQRGPLTRTMQKEITAAGWSIAGPRAYPRIFALNVPGDRVTAEHVEHATRCLRAVSARARGADPEAATGVRVSPLSLPDELLEEEPGEDERLDYFTPPRQAAPICAEGPGADLEAPLRVWEEQEAMHAAEEARLARLIEWLDANPADGSASAEDADNARRWEGFITFMGLSAGGATEYDLRLFLYDYYPRKGKGTPESARALGGSLRRIFRFMEEREGIRYPFAEAVLAELDEVARRGEADGMPVDQTLLALSWEVYDDLEDRLMLHGREGFGGRLHWPDAMNPMVAVLDRELQRRWLLWYDEAVRQGITDFADLEALLEERRAAWENAPHPGLEDGETPAIVVRAYLESDAFPGNGWRKLAG
jgi:SEC-C motif